MHVILLRLAKLDVVLLRVRTVAVIPVQYLPRATTRHAAIDTPRLDHPAIIMDADVAFTQPAIQCALRIATAVVSCASGVRQRFVRLDDDGEVEFDVLSRDRLNGWEEAVTVRAIANGSSRDTTKADLVEKIELPVWLEATVEEMRRVGKASCTAVCGISLTEECLHDIHHTTEEMSSTAQCCRADGTKNGTGRDFDVDQVVKPVIYHCVRIVDGEEVVA